MWRRNENDKFASCKESIQARVVRSKRLEAEKSKPANNGWGIVLSERKAVGESNEARKCQGMGWCLMTGVREVRGRCSEMRCRVARGEKPKKCEE